MATYTVTTSNWNSAAFWSGIGAVNGDTLDMSALGATYSVTYDIATGIMTLSDGTSTFTVGDAGAVGTDATLGGGFIHDFNTMYLTQGGDSITMGSDAHYIVGGDGDDTIHAGGGNDTVEGGAGNDYLDGGDGNDQLTGGAGDDRFVGGTGNDVMTGGDGDDLFFFEGNWGTDTVFGDVNGGSSSDSNNDLLDFRGADAGINATFSDWEDGTVTSGANSVSFENIEGIRGSHYNDTIDASADGSGLSLDGGDGADSIIAGQGNDTVSGGSGADTLDGQAGADTIDGGTGADSILGGTGDDLLVGGSGIDTILGGTGADTIYGDEIDIGADAGTLSSFDFSTISATGDTGQGVVGSYAVYDNIGTTSDGTVVQAVLTVVDADDPNIEVSFNANSVWINDSGAAAAGTGVQLQFQFYDQATGEPIQISGSFTFTDIDTSSESVSANSADVDSVSVSSSPATNLTISDNGEQITAQSDNTSAVNTDQNHWAIFNYTGQQSLTFEVTSRGAGTNYAFSTQAFSNPPTTVSTTPESQNDYIDAGDGDDLIYAGEGNDTIYYGEGHDTVYAGAGNDVIDDVGGFAYTMSSTIYGEAGNDTVYGTAAGDYIDGGADNDQLFGEVGDDTLVGGAGSDGLFGADGADALYGGTGADWLDGGQDADTIHIEDGFGSDTVIGGEATTTGRDQDRLDFSALSTGVSVDYTGIEAGTATDGTDTLSFSQIEQIVTTEQADTVDATLDGSFDASDIEVDLGGGDDFFQSWGQDTNGNANVDTVYGGAGNDTISTGGGDDQIHGGAGNDSIASGFSVDGAGDTVWGGAGDDTITSIDGATGTNSAVGDHVDGGTGNDSIVGSDDTGNLYQGDTLIGGTGDDTIEGLGGDDLIYGDLMSSTTLTYYIDDTGNLYQLNHATGGTQTLLQSGLQVYGDIATGADGFLYGVTQSNDPSSATSGIYRIDPATGTETLVGDIPNATESYSSIVIDAQGRIFISEDTSGELRMYEFDDINGYVQTGVMGTLQPNTQDIIFIDQDTAWAVANGVIYSYDVAADGTFSNETNLGQVVAGQTDIVGLQVSEYGAVVALEASGEGHYTFNTTTPSWVSTGYVAAHSGSITGAAAHQDQGLGIYGNDLILGGDGNDTIFTGEGNDTVYGGAGNDYIDDRNGVIESGSNLMDGGAGNDTIFGGDGRSTIYGGTGNDQLYGEGGADIFINADNFGNDTVTGGETAGTSTDSDTLSFEDMTLSGVTVTLTGAESGTATDGVSTLTFTGIEAFVLTDQSDTWDASAVLTGWTVDLGGGDDTILSGAGNDSIEGGAGSDTFTFANGWGQDTISGGEAGSDFDTLDLSGVTAALTVTYTGDEAGTISDGTNVITFSGIERIILGQGNDTVDASADSVGVNIETADGYDVVTGGSGNDSITSWGGYDTIDGGAGDDTLKGAGSLVGGTGNDVLDFTYGGGPGAGGFNIADGGAGDDSIIGGDGQNEWIFLSDGNDTIDGGTQEAGYADWISGERLTEGFYADMQAGTATWGIGNLATFTNIEAADGSDFDDTILGTSGSDTMTGGLGNDSLSGRAGADSLDGQEGDDTFVMEDGFGADTIIGGETGETSGDRIDFSALSTGINVNFTTDEAGSFSDGTDTGSFTEIENITLTEQDDTLDASSTAGAITVEGLGGADSIIGSTGDDSIDGGDGNDTLRGADGADTITGGLGDDSIYGNEGDDWLEGGDGSDSLYGETGDDYVSGGDGDDTVEGNEGNDTLYGGAGNDYLRGSYGNDILYGGTGDDSLWGGWGDDTFVIENGFGNDTVDAEGVDETTGDVLDLTAVTDDLTIDLRGVNPEIGTVSDGTSTLSFDEIETILLGSGRDTILLGNGSGADFVTGFDLTDSGDGTTKDQIDVSGMTDLNGAQVNTGDVTVSDDGSGNAVLSFPNGESITLIGVAPAAVSDPAVLASMGIPAPDYVITGTSGADSIDGSYTADAQGDMIDDSDAADASQNDVVDAGAGNDTVSTGAGDDSVLAGDGDDSVLGGAGNDTLLGEAGADVLRGGDGADSLSGGAGDDTLDGGTGDDTLQGDDGDDVFALTDGFGNDVITGGEAGETNGDTLDLSALTTGVTLDLSSADPEAGTVSDGTSTAAFSEIENFSLGGGRDTIRLADGGAARSVSGFDLTDSGDGSTNDQLDVSGLTTDGGTTPVNITDVVVSDDGSGNAVLTFPGGESITLLGVTPAQVDSYAELAAIGIPDTRDEVIDGTSGDDTIDTGYTGDPDGDMVDAADNAAANDDDSIVAGAGNDSVVAGAGDDTVSGDAGDDTLLGGDGADSLSGGTGNDSLDGGTGADTLLGGDGRDTLAGGSGADSLEGGADEDLFLLADGFGADTLTGGETATSGSDDDTLDAGAVTSPLTVTYSGDEAGTITDGTDTASFFEIESLVLGSGSDSVDGSATTSGMDVDAGAGDDTLLGGSGADSLQGGAGADRLTGGAGDDTLIGGTGSDTLDGGLGNDKLDGGDDDDSLSGGDGDDTLLGGAGADTLSGGAGADSVDGGVGADVITAGSGDTVSGGDGDDTFNTGPSHNSGGNFTIVGGEADETIGDTLNITGPATINMTGAESGTVTWLDGTVLTFSEIENVNYVPCFTPGTRIKTALGERDVSDIAVGDLVLTRDNGYQPVRWVGMKMLSGRQLRHEPSLQPIRIRANAFGKGLPECDMLVSPQHRVAMTGARVQLLTGEDEVLAAAGSLTHHEKIKQVSPGKGVEYVHFMFDRHELVMSDGLWTESFQPGDLSLAGLDRPQREELFRLFPELAHQHGQRAYGAARMTLKGYQARLLTEV